MRQEEIEILPGRPTRMWTYDGEFPGPTIRRPSGEATAVTFAHDLPDAAGELTVHLHGGHNPSAHDGQPGAPPTTPTPPNAYCDLDGGGTGDANQLLISPGESRTYSYPMVEDGSPERAAFHWYHDHRCHQTARNVWKGLAGMWITDDDFDAGLPLPAGARDIPLMLTDRTLNGRNQLTEPFSENEGAPDDGTVGDRILVNGAYLPHHDVSGRRHRLRILNASLFRSYNLRLSNGAEMTQIATDSGLMPEPVERKTILVGPGERVEVVVDFGEFPNRDVRLESVKRAGAGHRSQKTHVGPLLEFRVGRRKLDPSSVPASLRPLPGWTESLPGDLTEDDIAKTWELGVGTGIRPRWTVNGRQYDPSYVEHEATIETTEVWRIQNPTIAAHLVHLHHTDWYLLERDGAQPPKWERCLKETFFMDPHSEIVVAGRFSDHLGKYVVHCHMLDHEDHGLMSQFEVAAA